MKKSILLLTILSIATFFVSCNSGGKQDAQTEKQEIKIEFVQIEKYSFPPDEYGNSPDINIYQVNINEPEDSTKLEEAVKIKCKEEPKFSGAYCYFENTDIPKWTKNTNWNDADDFFSNTNAIATINVDCNGERWYQVMTESGELSKMKKL